MVAELFQIEGINILDGDNLAIRGPRNLGRVEYTDAGLLIKKAKDRTTDAHRKDRGMNFVVVVTGSTVDNLRANFEPLKTALDLPYFELVNNFGGVLEENRTFYGFNASYEIVLPELHPTANWLEWEIHISCNARPLALDSAIELPRNFLVDPTMCEDYSGDGIPNSFVNNDSAPVFAHSHFCNAIDGAYIYASSAAAVAGQFAGISQTSTSILAAQTWSFRAEYKCTNAASCRYFVSVRFLNAGGTIISETFLVNGATLATDWAEVKAENILAPAGTTQGQLIAYIWADNTPVTGTIRVRDAMAVQTSVFTRGKNNAVIVYGSEWAETPTTFRLKNIPGDAEALAIMQLGETVGGAAVAHDHFYLGITKKGLDNRRLVFKFTDLANSDNQCLGGIHSIALTGYLQVTLPATLKGKYWVIGRCNTYSTTYATDQYHIDIAPGVNALGAIFSTSKIVPFATQKWTEISFGTVDFSFYDPSWGNLSYTLNVMRDSGNNNWYCDYIELMPLDAIARAEINAAVVKLALMSDTISDREGLFKRRAESNIPVIWPMDFSEVYVFGGAQYSNTVNLPAGDSNVVIHCSPQPADTTQELSGRSGALLGIKLIPRWSE